MKHDHRFNSAVQRFDAANGEDPQTIEVDGKPEPRELVFNQRVYDWVTKLADDPSEALLLAARSHTLKRWEIPRSDYSMTTIGYHAWRDACAEHHAEEAVAILRDLGYEDVIVEEVEAFILKKNWPQDAEACALEDADCLVFLEMKLADYTDDWDHEKMQRILQRTLRKMTPEARQHAAKLSFSKDVFPLVEEAMRAVDPDAMG